MFCRCLLLSLILLMSLPKPSCASAVNDTVSRSGPLLIWQSPWTASATAAVFLTGASPLVFHDLHKYNLFVREEVQLFRKQHFDHRRYHFDNTIQYLSLVSVFGLKILGVPNEHSVRQLFCRSLTSVFFHSVFVVPIKFCVDEWRPDRGNDKSFPSGHTAFAFAGAEMLRLEYSDVSPLIPIAGYGIAVVTCFMRIYNDRHWTSDVLGGAAVGVLSANLAYLVNEKIIDPLFDKYPIFSSRKNTPQTNLHLQPALQTATILQSPNYLQNTDTLQHNITLSLQ